MTEQPTSTPMLRREARPAKRPESQLRLYIAVTAVMFSVVGVFAGLGLSWMFAPPTEVTMVRQAPRVNSWCVRTGEHRGETTRLIWTRLHGVESVITYNTEAEPSDPPGVAQDAQDAEILSTAVPDAQDGDRAVVTTTGEAGELEVLEIVEFTGPSGGRSGYVIRSPEAD